MAKTRRRIPKTVRMLPSVAAILHEVAVEEASYRFLNEAEALETAMTVGALILAGQMYHSGRGLDAITADDVVSELRTRLIPIWDFLAANNALPATVQGGLALVAPESDKDPMMLQTDVSPLQPLIDPQAANLIQTLGGGFLDDDDD